jgi:glutamate racemase
MALKASNKPIGIFDSGIGGLTVAKAIQRVLPGESLIYFGDTLHLPYGEKSPKAITRYSEEITDFLLSKGCKCIVIACNTASSIAYEAVKKRVGNKAVVFNVIDPVAEYVATHFDDKKIGIIATKATVKSGMYLKKIQKINPTLEVSSYATPLLAPMIEEGFFNNKISRTIINSYLSNVKLKNIKALILACTHYPLIKPEIEEFYKKKVQIIDSAQIVANYIESKLREKHLITNKKTVRHFFYLSDLTESFIKSTRYFFKKKIKFEKHVIP